MNQVLQMSELYSQCKLWPRLALGLCFGLLAPPVHLHPIMVAREVGKGLSGLRAVCCILGILPHSRASWACARARKVGKGRFGVVGGWWLREPEAGEAQPFLLQFMSRFPCQRGSQRAKERRLMLYRHHSLRHFFCPIWADQIQSVKGNGSRPMWS